MKYFKSIFQYLMQKLLVMGNQTCPFNITQNNFKILKYRIFYREFESLKSGRQSVESTYFEKIKSH